MAFLRHDGETPVAAAADTSRTRHDSFPRRLRWTPAAHRVPGAQSARHERRRMAAQPPRRTDRHDDAPPPHDEDANEPLGPMTPDSQTPLGDTPEVHDEISP